MRFRARHGAAALVATTILFTQIGPSDAASDPAAGPAPEVVLVEQSAISPPGSTFVARVQLPGIPADGSVRIVVHQRVRSRSELALSMEGEGLRSEVLATVKALSTLPAQPDGTRRLTLSLDPASGGLPLSTEGVYPVELIAQDAALNPVATLVTHLIVPPAAGDDAPSLGVAVVAEVSAPPALQPDGTVVLAAADVEAMTGVIAGLGAAPTVPASIAARPETIDALLGSAEPGYAELVDALRAATPGRTVLSEPYVEVSPDALVPAGLFAEINEQAASGRAVLTDELGADPVGSVALSPPALGATGMATLAVQGVSRIVVTSDQVEPLEPGIISYSLAQPFVLAPPEDNPDDGTASLDLQGFATDPEVLERLTTDGSPGLVASRVLAELALLRLEQPSVARSTILPLDPTTRGEVVRLVLHGIGAGRPFAPMTLDEAFDHAGPLLDGGGNPVERSLLPATPEDITQAAGRAFQDARADLETYRGLVGEDNPSIEPLARHLLVAAATELSEERRREHVEAVVSTIDLVSSQVSAPETFTLTLAAREGTIPLTIQNTSGMPLRVSVRLRSQRLDFPEGEVIPLVLLEESTRIDIPVRARTSGAFPLQIDVMTPDGQRRLAMSRYTVRSTAVSGAGLVLSIGAGVFLVVWWARHWHRTRRSARLVTTGAHTARGA